MILSTNDTTNRTKELQEILDTGYLKLGPGEFYVDQLTIPVGGMLEGCGASTRLIHTKTTPYLVHLNSEGTIKNIALLGEWTGRPDYENEPRTCEQTGIFISGVTNNAIIDCCFIRGFTKYGIWLDNTTVACRSVLMSNCEVSWCDVGLYADKSEYMCVSSCTFRSNRIGVRNYGGNNKFSACGFDTNHEGFEVGGDYNNGHGSASACTFNHNTQRALRLTEVIVGYVFSGCQFHDGMIEITEKTQGILFSGCQFGNWLKFRNYSTRFTVFSGCIFSRAPKTDSDEFIDPNETLRFIDCINFLKGADIE